MKTQPGRLTKALLVTADDMRRVGVMDAAAHAKITLRHLGSKADAVPAPITGDEIRSLRERANPWPGRVRPVSQPSPSVMSRNWSAARSGRPAPRWCC